MYILLLIDTHLLRVAKLLARLLATVAHWVRIQKFLKIYKMGDISKGVVNTLLLAKQYTKKYTHTDVKCPLSFSYGDWRADISIQAPLGLGNLHL
jgi:hypothetical protein